MMLALDSLRWHELWHARGDGDDIPALLRQLEAQRFLPLSQTEEDLWEQFWDRLEHQFTVYDASYAAVPHFIRIAGLVDKKPHYSFFLLPAAIEIRRVMGFGQPLLDDLTDSYHHAIQQLPHLASRFVDASWDEMLTRSIATAVAVAKGHILLADILMDLRPETIEEYYQWKGWSYHKLNLNDPDAAADAKVSED